MGVSECGVAIHVYETVCHFSKLLHVQKIFLSIYNTRSL